MRYIYKAISIDGKIKSGNSFDLNKEDLIGKLEKEGYFLLELNEYRPVGLLNRKFQLKEQNKLSYKEISIITNQIHILLDSGIPIKETLTILIDQDYNARTSRFLKELLLGLDKGILLSETLEREKHQSLFIALLKSGEETGNLGATFLQASEYYKKKYILKQKIISDLIYPIILIVATIIATIFIITNVLPEIINLFDYNNKELPIFTKTLIYITTYIYRYKYEILSIIVFINILTIYLYKKNKYKLKKFVFKMPIISKYLKMIYSLNFFETQRLMIKSGLSLVESIEISNNTISNEYINSTLKDILKEVEQGREFSSLLKKADIFPELISSMLKVGEESGEMTKVITKSIKYLEEELEEFIDRSITLIEPILLLLITILIGSLVIAFIVPMFEITNFI